MRRLRLTHFRWWRSFLLRHPLLVAGDLVLPEKPWNMSRILVFDVNETLLDVRAMEPQFVRIFGDPGALREWFSLLLLHSEVAALAGPYFDFATLAEAVLTMVAETRKIRISSGDVEAVLQAMLSLPPHPEVQDALADLQAAGIRLVALTNSSDRMVQAQLANAGLAPFFESVFSVNTVQRYKPAPEPYRMVASALSVPPARLRMVAAHAWDILGAMRVGYAGAFVARPGRVLFPLTPKPDVVGENLRVVAAQIIQKDVAVGEAGGPEPPLVTPR